MSERRERTIDTAHFAQWCAMIERFGGRSHIGMVHQ
jgi:hypothetical protein